MKSGLANNCCHYIDIFFAEGAQDESFGLQLHDKAGFAALLTSFTRWIGFSEDDVNRRRRKMSGEASLPTR